MAVVSAVEEFHAIPDYASPCNTQIIEPRTSLSIEKNVMVVLPNFPRYS